MRTCFAIEDAIAEHNDVTRSLAEEHGTLLLPLDELMPREESFWDDAIHVNAKGAARKAAIYAQFLDESLLGAETDGGRKTSAELQEGP